MIGIIITYVIFLVVFIIYSIAALYHLESFGFVGDACRPVMITYIILAIFVIIFSFMLLLRSC